MADRSSSAPPEPRYRYSDFRHRSTTPFGTRRSASPPRSPRVHSEESSNPKSERNHGPLPEGKLKNLDPELWELHKLTTSPPPAPRWTKKPVPAGWEPPLAIGASLGEGLSRYEIAERTVLQWKAIITNTRRRQPGADLSGLEEQLKIAEHEFDTMEEIEDNFTPLTELKSVKVRLVYDRVEELEDLLISERCPAGRVNINGAINAYRHNRIRCWDKWTVLYAGHVVDICDTYESFSYDRAARLDRYFERYGPGWLWYEPPLTPKNGFGDHLFASTWAEPRLDLHNRTGTVALAWHITMGFRRVKGFHSRIVDGVPRSSEVPSDSKVPVYSVEDYTSRRDGQRKKKGVAIIDDPDGPRCVFSMHLDSGASLPSLHNADLTLLGINPEEYPAQSSLTLSTANGTARAAIYELRVDVCRFNGESLVGSKPVYPDERHELGGIIPVSVLSHTSASDTSSINEQIKKGSKISEEAMAKRSSKTLETRLSGMLPFQVCYYAAAPGMVPRFGEDRRDVLGADLMPGQLRWELHKPMQGDRKISVKVKDRPTVRFEHQIDDYRRLVDEDMVGERGVSIVTIVDESRNQIFKHEPGKTQSRQKAAKVRTKRTLDVDILTELRQKRPRLE